MSRSNTHERNHYYVFNFTIYLTSKSIIYAFRFSLTHKPSQFYIN